MSRFLYLVQGNFPNYGWDTVLQASKKRDAVALLPDYQAEHPDVEFRIKRVFERVPKSAWVG